MQSCFLQSCRTLKNVTTVTFTAYSICLTPGRKCNKFMPSSSPSVLSSGTVSGGHAECFDVRLHQVSVSNDFGKSANRTHCVGRSETLDVHFHWADGCQTRSVDKMIRATQHTQVLANPEPTLSTYPWRLNSRWPMGLKDNVSKPASAAIQ